MSNLNYIFDVLQYDINGEIQFDGYSGSTFIESVRFLKDEQHLSHKLKIANHFMSHQGGTSTITRFVISDNKIKLSCTRPLNSYEEKSRIHHKENYGRKLPTEITTELELPWGRMTDPRKGYNNVERIVPPEVKAMFTELQHKLDPHYLESAFEFRL